MRFHFGIGGGPRVDLPCDIAGTFPKIGESELLEVERVKSRQCFGEGIEQSSSQFSRGGERGHHIHADDRSLDFLHHEKLISDHIFLGAKENRFWSGREFGCDRIENGEFPRHVMTCTGISPARRSSKNQPKIIQQQFICEVGVATFASEYSDGLASNVRIFPQVSEEFLLVKGVLRLILPVAHPIP